MKKYMYKAGMLALFAGVLFTSCEPEVDYEFDPSSGEADFSKYVAVGNSLTAGYQDGGLYLEGQQSSFPAILAGQFAEAGGGEFVQPLFSEEQRNGSGYLRLAGFTQTGSPITESVTTNLAIRATSPQVLYTKYTGAAQNLGVPGIRVADIKTVGYGSDRGNAFFERLAENAGQTYLQYVESQSENLTFFTNWLGNNDVLGYATAGGFAGTLTDPGLFETNYGEMMDVLTRNEAKGLVMTIPDVTSIPFFTTVGPTVKATLQANNVPGMVALTGSGNTRIQFLTTDIQSGKAGSVLFTLTSSAYAGLIGRPTGKYWRDLAKQTNPSNPTLQLAGLLLNYGIDTTQAFGVSGGNPWPSALLLDAAEQGNVQTSTTTFNNIIKTEAQQHNVAVFDVNAYFNSIKNGFRIDEVNYSPAFITGNLFSLDGVHPNSRGYAILANEMIREINKKYNAQVPTVNVTNYRTVVFP